MNNICNNINTILNCIQLSILLEVSAYPKPGNVHRIRDYPDTRYEHFIVAGVVVRNAFKQLCNRIIKLKEQNNNYSKLELGKYILQAIIDSNKWQKGGNVNLGVVLLLMPLAAASTSVILTSNHFDQNLIRNEIDLILKNSTYNDTINLYKAIKVANPGGMGKVSKYDLNDPDVFKKIKDDNINLFKIFYISRDWDSISNELVSKYRITFEIGLPYMLKSFEKTKDINISIVDTFLKIVSEVPDTLIIRQHGIKIAKDYSNYAKKIISKGGLSNNENRKIINEWDNKLSKMKVKINPGTTADLTVSTLFVALLSGLRF